MMPRARRSCPRSATGARLAKVEALARAAGTDGERRAAEAAAARLRGTVEALRQDAVGRLPEHADIEHAFTVDQPWAGRLLTALCHRYAIEPAGFDAAGRIVVRAPRAFVERVLVPEFEQVRAALAGLMGELACRSAKG